MVKRTGLAALLGAAGLAATSVGIVSPAQAAWHHGSWIGPAIGFGAGVAVGSALAAPHYAYGPYAYNGAEGYCASRFRSDDPYSHTYLGYDGLRHPCP